MVGIQLWRSCDSQGPGPGADRMQDSLRPCVRALPQEGHITREAALGAGGTTNVDIGFALLKRGADGSCAPPQPQRTARNPTHNPNCNIQCGAARSVRPHCALRLPK